MFRHHTADDHPGEGTRTREASTSNGASDPQRYGGASLGIRATVGGPDAGASAPGVAEAGPAGAPDLKVVAEGSRDSEKPARVQSSAACDQGPANPDRTNGGPGISERAGRKDLAAFLHDDVAALDRPWLAADHPDSRPMKPKRLRPRGAEPRDQHRTMRFAPSEIALIEQAVAERGPSFSGFVADAAVAVATNRITAVLPHERALRALGEELGRGLYALGKVGNNLNQLVRQLHMSVPVEPVRVESTLARLDDVLADIHDVTVRLNEAA